MTREVAPFNRERMILILDESRDHLNRLAQGCPAALAEREAARALPPVAPFRRAEMERMLELSRPSVVRAASALTPPVNP